MAGTSKGLIQIVRVDPELIADIIPVDFPINLMLAAAWDEATCPKYNFSIRSEFSSLYRLLPYIFY